MTEHSRAVASKGGFTVFELFILNDDGKPKSVGFGVFSSSGALLDFYPTEGEALDRLDELARDYDSPSP